MVKAYLKDGFEVEKFCLIALLTGGRAEAVPLVSEEICATQFASVVPKLRNSHHEPVSNILAC